MHRNAIELFNAINHGTTMPGALMTAIAGHLHDLETHIQVSKNFGLLGGWLRTEILTYSNGDPTGYAHSTHSVERPA